MMKIQWKPNVIKEQKRICFTRIYWKKGIVGDGKGYSAKLSISLAFAWYDLWIGLFIKKEYCACIIYLCIIPCFPIRFHFQKSYGGSYF